jgi:hypothetical protein
VSCVRVLGTIQKEGGGGVGNMELNSPLLIGLATAAPRLLLWIVIIIVSLVILRNGRGKAENYIFAGIGLKLAGALLSIPGTALVPWLVQNGYSMTQSASFGSGYGIFCNVVNMVAIICFVYAFKVKFDEKRKSEEYV